MLGKIIDFPSPTKKKQKKGEEGRKTKKILVHISSHELNRGSPKIQDSVPLVRVLIMNPL